MTEPYSDVWPGAPEAEGRPEMVLAVRFLEGDLQRLTVQRGDTFVLMVDEVLSRDEQESILSQWEGVFPGTKLVLLPRGYRLGVVEGLKP